MYPEFNGGEARPNDVPNAGESKRFWGDIQSVGKEHKQEAEWLEHIRNELRNEKYLPEKVVISTEKVTKQCRKMPNWKASWKDGVQGYWIRILSHLYERIAVQTNKIFMRDDSLPSWITHGCTVLSQKNLRKGNAVENYGPITCLLLIRKLLTEVITEEMYDYLEQDKLLPEENKKNADEAVEQRINCLLTRMR